MEAGRNTADGTRVLRRFVHSGERFFDDGVNLRHVAFLAALRDLKNTCLGFLHKFVDVLRLVKALLLNLRSQSDDIACRRFLGYDLGMVTKVCRGSHTTRQLRQINHTAGFLQRTHALELLAHGEDVYRQVFGG